MPGEFDINDICSKFASEMIINLGGSAIINAKLAIGSSENSIDKTLKRYAKQSIEKVRNIRTVLSDEPFDLLSIYQPSRFRLGYKNINEIELRFNISSGLNHMVINGNAGAGKSMFLRRHFVRRLEEKSCLPVLLELNTFNHTDASLYDVLRDTLQASAPWIDSETYKVLLRSGKMEIMLDALDEVGPSKRNALNASIEKFIRDFPKTRVILTTRYGDKYSALPTAIQYHILPFSKTQAISLVKALEYDSDSKDRFARALDSGLYEKSPDLLSNPLLCSIMLLTYRRFASIPDQLHQYYQQAYEVLFSRHDAAKPGSVTRELLSGLNLIQVENILDYFSAISYAAEVFEFSEEDMASLLQEAVNSLSLTNVNADDVKNDLIEAISIIGKDGFEYKFVHRSFQEYFCSHYISKSPADLALSCIEAVKARSGTDSVLVMAYALNKPKFEEVWLFNSIQFELDRLEKLYDEGKFFDIVYSLYPNIRFSPDIVEFHIGNNEVSRNFQTYLRCLDEKPAFIISIAGVRAVDIFLYQQDIKQALYSIREFFGRDKNMINKCKHILSRKVNSGDLTICDIANYAGALTESRENPLWKAHADIIVTKVKAWKENLEHSKALRATSALEKFRSAIAKNRSR